MTQRTLFEAAGEQPPEPALVSGDEVMKAFHLSRTTLWRLRGSGLPCVTVGRLVRYDLEAVRRWLEGAGAGVGGSGGRNGTNGTHAAGGNGTNGTHRGSSGHGGRNGHAKSGGVSGAEELPPCHWSASVALDPKHRPQSPHRPSSTARREWWRYPQEAYLLDEGRWRYRRLLAREVAVIQGFPADWGVASGLGEFDLIRGYGNAVAPPLAKVLFETVQRFCPERLSGVVEICAGFGGMALGASDGLNGVHLALVDNWGPAIRVLRGAGTWPQDRVFEADITAFDWSRFVGRTDLLCGGPPCQPWSNAGAGLGHRDERDLLSFMPELVATLSPKAFVFENVPGLLQGDNADYAAWLIRRLRCPAAGLRYGVAAAVLNAADYGVPQVRRRVFLVGILDADVAVVHRMFDELHSRRTHADPRAVIPAGLSPWRTIAEAIPDWGDDGHAWRRWVVLEGQEERNGASMNHAATHTQTPVPRRTPVTRSRWLPG